MPLAPRMLEGAVATRITTLGFQNRCNMIFLLIASLRLLARAQSDRDVTGDSPSRSTINGTLEYDSFCRMCPYNICTHTTVPQMEEVYELTCWAK